MTRSCVSPPGSSNCNSSCPRKKSRHQFFQNALIVLFLFSILPLNLLFLFFSFLFLFRDFCFKTLILFRFLVFQSKTKSHCDKPFSVKGKVPRIMRFYVMRKIPKYPYPVSFRKRPVMEVHRLNFGYWIAIMS